MFRLAINEAGQVEYRALIDSLNWRQRSVPAPSSSGPGTAGAGCCGAAGAPASSWQRGGDESAGSQQLVQAVRADALMHDLTTA